MPMRDSVVGLPWAFPVHAIVPSNRAWAGPAAAQPARPKRLAIAAWRLEPGNKSYTAWDVRLPDSGSAFSLAVCAWNTALGRSRLRRCAAARPQILFYFHPSGSRQFLPKHEKPRYFSTLWQYANHRPIPGLHVGSGRIQTADHDWPFMSLLSEFRTLPAIHLMQVSHRSAQHQTAAQVRARAGLEEIRPHAFRQDLASHALTVGQPLPVIDKLPGRSDIEFTVPPCPSAQDSIHDATGAKAILVISLWALSS